MAKQNSKAASEISVVEIGKDGETIATQTPGRDSAGVGDRAGRLRPAVRGVLERRWRRKNDINTLAGLIREHSRVIAAMHNGRISLDKGEVLSRAYGRHQVMVTAHEQQSQLDAIQQQLAALRGESSSLLPHTEPMADDLEGVN